MQVVLYDVKQFEDDAEYVEFKEVPVVTPNGETLLNSLSFEVSEGKHTVIVGPNGAGKSSMFRTLGRLWPLKCGTIKKPSFKDLFYIPQRPYLPNGTLRDQIIYPLEVEKVKDIEQLDTVHS